MRGFGCRNGFQIGIHQILHNPIDGSSTILVKMRIFVNSLNIYFRVLCYPTKRALHYYSPSTSISFAFYSFMYQSGAYNYFTFSTIQRDSIPHKYRTGWPNLRYDSWDHYIKRDSTDLPVYDASFQMCEKSLRDMHPYRPAIRPNWISTVPWGRSPVLRTQREQIT